MDLNETQNMCFSDPGGQAARDFGDSSAYLGIFRGWKMREVPPLKNRVIDSGSNFVTLFYRGYVLLFIWNIWKWDVEEL